MTTTVIITSPTPNHNNIGVAIQFLDAAGEPSSDTHFVATLTDGQSTVVHVHSTARLVITEIAKVRAEPVPDAA
jgi:hypothetical protein